MYKNSLAINCLDSKFFLKIFSLCFINKFLNSLFYIPNHLFISHHITKSATVIIPFGIILYPNKNDLLWLAVLYMGKKVRNTQATIILCKFLEVLLHTLNTRDQVTSFNIPLPHVLSLILKKKKKRKEENLHGCEWRHLVLVGILIIFQHMHLHSI